MAAKVAINGFGRIGRLGLRAMLERHKKDLNVVAVNDMADLNTNAHLFRYDSTYGIFSGDIEVGEGVLKLDGRSIVVLNQKDPSRLPWKQLGVDIVIESTGVFTRREQLADRDRLQSASRRRRDFDGGDADHSGRPGARRPHRLPDERQPRGP